MGHLIRVTVLAVAIAAIMTCNGASAAEGTSAHHQAVTIQFDQGDAEVGTLQDGVKPWTGSDFTFDKIPPELNGLTFTRRSWNAAGDVSFDVPTKTTVYIILDGDAVTEDIRKTLETYRWTKIGQLPFKHDGTTENLLIYKKAFIRASHFNLPAGGPAGNIIAASNIEVKTPPTTQPAQPREGPTVADLFNLTGQAGLPSYLKCNGATYATSDGLTKGDIRTVDTDFFKKDFVLDVVFQYSGTDSRATGFVGIGEGSRHRDLRDSDSIVVELQGDSDEGAVNLLRRHDPRKDLIARQLSAGPHLLRFEKKDDALTVSVTNNFSGKYIADGSRTLAHFQKAASFLNRLNSSLFFGGDVEFKAVRLEIDGKLSDAGAPATQPSRDLSGRDGFIKLGPGLPPYFAVPENLLIGANGLELYDNTVLRTKEGNFIDKDFTLDVIYHFNPEQHSTLVIGIGDDRHENGESDIVAKIGGPAINGDISFGTHGGRTNSFNEKLGEDHAVGPNMVRLQKRGNTLTFAICAGYSGKFEPDFAATLPDLRHAGPNLTDKHSFLYIGRGGFIDQARLFVEELTPDKIADQPGAPPADEHITGPSVPDKNAVASNADDAANSIRSLTRLGSGRALPDCFNHADQILANKDGLSGGMVWTRDPISLKDEFTFDVMFKFDKPDAELRAGYGNNTAEPGAVRQAAMIKVYGPGRGQHAAISHGEPPEIEAGKLNGSMGPNILRVQKRGNTLTFSVAEDYSDRFAPVLVQTIPDLTQFAPLSNDASRLFAEGDNITLMGLGLTVNGKVLSDVNANTPTAPREETATPESRTASPPVASATPSREAPGGSATIDKENTLALATDQYVLTNGFGGTLLLLEGNQLRRLGPDGLSVRETLKLPNTYRWIAERKNYFVAMSDQTKSLDIIDKAKMTVQKSIQMDYYRRNDLCINPWEPICYVTVEKSTDNGFLKAILIVDEKTGDVHEPSNFIGTWIKLSPDGKILYSGYKDIYKKGDQLLFNPDSIDLLPVYGNIDMILVYDVSTPNPRFMRIQKEAGGNGQGLVLSQDGRRLSYLSFVGYPMYSKNISAWDPTDLAKRPVLYPTKDADADCKHLAFHPWLSIAAACGTSQGAICFDRESGGLQSDRLAKHMSLQDVKVNGLEFSPDGKNLILECNDAGSAYLLRVKLNLSVEELKLLRDPTIINPPLAPADPSTPGVKT